MNLNLKMAVGKGVNTICQNMPLVVKGAQASFVQYNGVYLMTLRTKCHHRLHLNLSVYKAVFVVFDCTTTLLTPFALFFSSW